MSGKLIYNNNPKLFVELLSNYKRNEMVININTNIIIIIIIIINVIIKLWKLNIIVRKFIGNSYSKFQSVIILSIKLNQMQ